MDGMFKNIETLVNVEMISKYEIININSMKSTFENCVSLTSIPLSGFSTYEVKSMHKLFSGSGISSIDLNIFNSSNVKDISNMFEKCNSLTSINFDNFNTSNVEDMSNLFHSCNSLTSINLNNIEASKVRNMSKMFSDCKNLKNVEISKL